VKHFRPENFRGLFNEWFCHAVFGGLGIPQPQAALMVAPVLGGDTKELAFVSLEATPKFDGTPMEIYRLEGAPVIPALCERLLSCPAMPSLVAADQLVMNGDRNWGNLVMTGKSSFVAIDHGDILGGPAWTEASLQATTGWFRSRQIDDWLPHAKSKESFKSAVLAASQVIEDNFFAIHTELRETLRTAEISDARLALDAVWWRALNLAASFGRELKLIV